MASGPPSNSQQLSPLPGQGLGAASGIKKRTTKLSTSSPEAIRVATEITPNRLANVLMRKGPLAIRVITAQLSIEVPGFDLLSLSKQRRLIMAAMEQGDPKNDVVFEKIGWGQWAVRHVGLDYIVTEPNGPPEGNARMNIHELREKAKLGWLKKMGSLPDNRRSTLPGKNPVYGARTRTSRRDSISNQKANMHNFKVPSEKLESPSNGLSDSEKDSDDDDDDDDDDDIEENGRVSHLRDLKMGFFIEADDIAIDEDSEDVAMEEDEDEEALFRFEADDRHGPSITKFKRSPPLKFANRVPMKFSPPPVLAGGRRKSSSSAAIAPNSVVKNTLHAMNRHQVFNRSRLNSIESLDNYIVSSARNSSLSVLSPPAQNSSLPSTSPLGSWNAKGDYLGHPQDFPLLPDHIAVALQNAGRRKLSFNESSIRSTLSSSLPRAHAHAGTLRSYENSAKSASSPIVSGISSRKHSGTQEIASDTEEEDWAAMGAETLRSHSVGVSSPASRGSNNKIQSEERTAARALVDLMGIV